MSFDVFSYKESTRNIFFKKGLIYQEYEEHEHDQLCSRKEHKVDEHVSSKKLTKGIKKINFIDEFF